MTTGDFAQASICEAVTEPTALYVELLDCIAPKIKFRNCFTSESLDI